MTVLLAKFAKQLFNHDKQTSGKSVDSGRFQSGWNMTFVNDAESKAISQIEEKLRHARDTASEDLDIIEIDLPPIKTEEREEVLEAIHTVFQAERIDNKLYIKRDSYGKGKVHTKLLISITTQLPSWGVCSKAIAVVNGNEFRPDVGGWSQEPTFAERFQPIVNRTPPPSLWIEVAFDRSNDCDNALSKIAYVQRYCPNTDNGIRNPSLGVPYLGHWGIGVTFNAALWYKMQWNEPMVLECGAEFVLIVIPYRSPIPANPNPGTTSVVATASASRSLGVPYLGHWGIGVAFNAVLWYEMQWNEHIVLECGSKHMF
ncbi:3636_t:CDS:2 [Paraglomus occultum]|uniref:3636_t:CDS:1 n=1 Tax=Paraglomus occultum TaxID=144539 RepID=A0A9N9GXQ0_9GLOM|nr:3636_t:CDS:2 [Paraglomus occultum]